MNIKSLKEQTNRPISFSDEAYGPADILHWIRSLFGAGGGGGGVSDEQQPPQDINPPVPRTLQGLRAMEGSK